MSLARTIRHLRLVIASTEELNMNKDFTKSSFSNGSGGSNCVEVARIDDIVVVRNSRFPDDVLPGFTKKEWDAFVKGVKAGEFDD